MRHATNLRLAKLERPPFLTNKPSWLWVPACAGTTMMEGHERQANFPSREPKRKLDRRRPAKRSAMRDQLAVRGLLAIGQMHGAVAAGRMRGQFCCRPIIGGDGGSRR